MAKGKYTLSDKALAARKAAAKKPRLSARKGTSEGEQAVQRALERIHHNLADCVELAEQVLKGYVEYTDIAGLTVRERVSPSDRIAVMKDFLDRGGLIKRQAVELSSEAVLPIEIVFKHGGLVK